jgi:hypothetical protein
MPLGIRRENLRRILPGRLLQIDVPRYLTLPPQSYHPANNVCLINVICSIDSCELCALSKPTIVHRMPHHLVAVGSEMRSEPLEANSFTFHTRAPAGADTTSGLKSLRPHQVGSRNSLCDSLARTSVSADTVLFHRHARSAAQYVIPALVEHTAF